MIAGEAAHFYGGEGGGGVSRPHREGGHTEKRGRDKNKENDRKGDREGSGS